MDETLIFLVTNVAVGLIVLRSFWSHAERVHELQSEIRELKSQLKQKRKRKNDEILGDELVEIWKHSSLIITPDYTPQEIEDIANRLEHQTKFRRILRDDQ
jgi:hypothetical protein